MQRSITIWGRRSGRTLHSRAARIARTEDGRLRHLVAASDGPDQLLADELEALARGFAEHGDWHHAASTYLQAAELAPGVDQREQATLRAIHGFTVSGDPTRAAALASATDSFADTVLRRFVIGSLRANEGDLAEGAELLRGAVELGRATGDPLVAPVIAHLAIVELFLLRVDESSRLAHEALRVSQSEWSIDAYGGADPLNILLFAHAAEGRYAEGLAAGLRPPDGGPPPGVDRPDGLMGRGTIRLFVDDPRGAHDDFTIAAEHYRRRGPASLWCMAIIQQARCEYALGDWDDALAHARLAISVGEDSGLGTVLPLAYATTVQVLAARGEWDEAAQRVRDAWSFGGAGVALDIAAVSALVDRARGDNEGAVRNLTGYATLAKAMPSIPGGAAYTVLYAEALTELGRVDDARDALAGLVAPDDGTPAVRFLVARARGRLAGAEGRTDDADAAFQIALERSVGLVHALEVPLAKTPRMARSSVRSSATRMPGCTC